MKNFDSEIWTFPYIFAIKILPAIVENAAMMN